MRNYDNYQEITSQENKRNLGGIILIMAACDVWDAPCWSTRCTRMLFTRQFNNEMNG